MVIKEAKKSKYGLWLLLLMVLFTFNSTAQHFKLTSPDKQTSVIVRCDARLSYEVSYKGNPIITPSAIGMEIVGHHLGIAPAVLGSATNTFHSTIDCPNCKFAELNEDYNELTLRFAGDYSLIFRAYDEGVAYRLTTNLDSQITITNEQVQFNLIGAPKAILPIAQNLTSWELPYTTISSSRTIPKNDKSILPALFSYDKTGIKVVLAEADVRDYPGMYIKVNYNAINGSWPAYPLKTVLGSWGNFVSVVKRRAPYIAVTWGKRSFPWRVIIISGDDRALLSNELIYKLAEPSHMTQTTWIQPGKAAWEWWTDALLPGANISSGMKNRNTALYKYYVDFAAKYHLEYVLIDAGWSDVFDLRKTNPQIDVREVIRYAREKNVNVFLWCVATTLLHNLSENMAYIKNIGAAGLKVDFFDRNDQEAINWYEQIARTAAEYKLMIDFHGCSVPTGLQRTYPNILNFEAVRGNECNKWDTTANPGYHLLIPFIRMLAGPMDYTPGSMRNKSKSDFVPISHGMPYSQGTRCHELAMYVLFDQPLAMLCGSPVLYEKYPDIMKYLSVVPTVFDDTKVLAAKLGEYALVAKRRGTDWYIGAMTNWTARSLTLDFNFLPSGKTFVADIYTDAHDSGQHAGKYVHQSRLINRDSTLELILASGGGSVIYLHE